MKPIPTFIKTGKFFAVTFPFVNVTTIAFAKDKRAAKKLVSQRWFLTSGVFEKGVIIEEVSILEKDILIYYCRKGMPIKLSNFLKKKNL